MFEHQEEVAFTESRRQWSVPVSVAVGATMLIGFWPAPSGTSSLDASPSAFGVGAPAVPSTIAIEPTSQVFPDSVSEGRSNTPSVDSRELPEPDVPPLRLELLLLGDPPVVNADVEAIEDVEVIVDVESPDAEPGGFVGDDQHAMDSDEGDGNSSAEIEEPNGSDVLQVVRWVGGSIAVSETADSATTENVSQVLRLAWNTQRQAVSEGAGSFAWASAFEHRSGFARVLGEQLRSSITPPTDDVITEAELVVTGVRIDTAGRAVASFCVVEDAGFGSFSGMQGQWGTVVATAGVVGLMRSSGGWVVDDVSQIGVVEAC